MTRPTCFILEPRAVESLGPTGFGPNGERFTIQQVNELFDELIEPALSGFGFRIMRSQDFGFSGAVERDHVQQARSADLIIANVTWADPVVLFGLGYRVALHDSDDAGGGLDDFQPIIALQSDKDQSTHFYIRGSIAYPVRYDRPTPRSDMNRYVPARQDLVDAIRKWQRAKEKSGGGAARLDRARENAAKAANDPDRARRDAEAREERYGPQPEDVGYATERSVGIVIPAERDVVAQLMSQLLKR